MKKITVDTLYSNGDSWTYGDELNNKDDCYVNLISKNYNLPLINNSLPGGSNERILRTTIQDVSTLLKQGKKPFVIVAWTLPHRFELFDTESDDFAVFAGPKFSKDPELGKLIWSRRSSDKSDVIMFLTQVISLQSFLKQNDIPYYMCNVFKILYELLDPKLLEIYQSQIDTNLYMYNLPFKVLLTPYINIKWGENFHPLSEGHCIIARFLIEQINIRYGINQ